MPIKSIIRKGKKFNKLTIIQEVYPYIGNNFKVRRFLCLCECGNKKEINLGHLKSGYTKSCGCLKHKPYCITNFIHGMSKQPIHKTWESMIQRCDNPKASEYKNYGGRGIKVCKRWYKFKNFYIDMGNKPQGTSLDRINNNGNYEFKNCRWATPKQQANNTRKNKFLTLKKRTMTIKQWSEALNVSVGAISYRIRRGWNIEKILSAKKFRTNGTAFD